MVALIENDLSCQRVQRWYRLHFLVHGRHYNV